MTEVYEALVKRLGEDVSRKTIERDIDELVEARFLIVMPGLPARYQLSEIEEIEVMLSIGEIKIIIQLLGDDSDLAQKLKKTLNAI